jgi:hypothetical protein
MKNKKQKLSIGLIIAAICVIVLGSTQLISANTNTGVFQSISIITIAALIILFVVGIWLFWVSFQ